MIHDDLFQMHPTVLCGTNFLVYATQEISTCLRSRGNHATACVPLKRLSSVCDGSKIDCLPKLRQVSFVCGDLMNLNVRLSLSVQRTTFFFPILPPGTEAHPWIHEQYLLHISVS